MPFNIVKSSKPVLYKVTAYTTIILKPSQSSLQHINYTALPKGRSFVFTATNPAASNALVDNNTPYICLLTNPTDKPLQIMRNTHLGTIYKEANTAYFVANSSKALLAIAAVIELTPRDITRA